MAHRGSLSLHAILEESPNDDDSTSSEGERSGFLVPNTWNAVISAIPIMTTPSSEETLAFQTIPAVPSGLPYLDLTPGPSSTN
jgi:hypothetical protein